MSNLFQIGAIDDCRGLLPVVKLIRKVGEQVKILTQAQKGELSISVYRQGYMALFVSIWCGFIISRHPYERCIYATTFGLSLLCFFILCVALKKKLAENCSLVFISIINNN